MFPTATDLCCRQFYAVSSTKVSKARSAGWQLPAHWNPKEISPLYAFLCVHHSLLVQWKASKACLIIQSHKYVRNPSHSLSLHSHGLALLALWQPRMHDVCTAGHCRAECISEGLAGYLARFSGQRTNYSGMRRCFLTPVSRRVHNLAAPHRWSLKPLQTARGDPSTWQSCCMCVSGRSASDFQRLQAEFAFCFRELQHFDANASDCLCAGVETTKASRSSRLLRPGRRKETGQLGTFRLDCKRAA